jgi:uncharacterized repeat protein (TIGR03803 family)
MTRRWMSGLAPALLLAACSTPVSVAPVSLSRASAPMSRHAGPATNALTVLYSFQNNGSDGQDPRAGVLLDDNGNIFGTTQWGGSGDWGTVYELKPVGSSYQESVLYSCSTTYGVEPYSIPIEDQSGALFFTAYDSIIILSPTGSGYEQSAVVDFTGGAGTDPTAGLLAVGTKLYTAAEVGQYTFGTIDALDESDPADLASVYAFKGPRKDGAEPGSSLVADAAGALYSTTNSGGVKNLGTVFRFDPQSGAESVLWSFHGKKDGQDPKAPVVVDGAGNVYGTTYLGGKHGLGVLFKLSPHGSAYTFSVLHAFAGPPADGQFPVGGLALLDGLLYGTTFTGGADNDGTIFSLSTSGSGYAVVHNFEGSDGIGPQGTLVVRGATLYGTTLSGGTGGGGAKGVGTVFSFTP